MTPNERVRNGFARTFGVPPQEVVFVPGRVNLIGEHVDYNGGLVLPMPIAVGTTVAWSATPDERIEAVALDFDEARDNFLASDFSRPAVADWRTYLRGMVAELAARGLVPRGARLAIGGSIPRGSGLSSSASLCVAIGRALGAAWGDKPLPPLELALAAQAAEHNWAGVRCGIMDQMAVAAGDPGAALLLDCRSLASRLVPLPADWAVMIVQSGVRRGLVDGHYNQRRRDCEAAAVALGLGSLREASLDMIETANLDPLVRRRACHVVSEIARTARAVAAIESRDIASLGRLFAESHASMRDDFEITVPAIDALVACLDAAIGGEGGARMTGGGFGGAVVAVLRAREVDRVRGTIGREYARPDGAPLEIMIERAEPAASGECE